MKGRMVILAAVVACFAIAVSVQVLRQSAEKEPSYNGKRLSEWLDIYIVADLQDSRHESLEAAEAVRRIGTNSLPLLLKWVREDDQVAPWRIRLYPFVYKLPAPISRVIFWALLEDKPAARAHRGQCAFRILGSQARPAVAELSARMTRPESSLQLRRAAMSALCEIGKDGLAPLLEALTNKQQPDRPSTAFYIGYMSHVGADISPAIPVLIQCLKDADPYVSEQAAVALGRLRVEPELAVPALAASLDDPRARTRANVIEALMAFKENARPAVASLKQLLVDSDHDVRVAATNALRDFAPEEVQAANVSLRQKN